MIAVGKNWTITIELANWIVAYTNLLARQAFREPPDFTSDHPFDVATISKVNEDHFSRVIHAVKRSAPRHGEI